MSWLYSQALVAEYLGDICSDGEPSVPSSGNPTQLAYCALDRMTAFSRLSRFGMTFKPLTEDRGEELLTSYLAGFPVRTSQSRGGGQALMANGPECGDIWRGSWAKYDPDSCSWKTVQPSLLGDLEESSVTWPRSGMTANGQCWELPTLGHRTSETDSGLWPTPTASMMPCEGTQRIMRKKWQAGELTLEEASAIAGRDVRKAQGKVSAMWPTPIASDSRGSSGKPAPRKQMQLVDAVRYATPTARHWRSGKASQATMERNSRPLSEQIGGSLNPDWVEWLMNWPITWSTIHAVNPKEFKRWQEASAAALQASSRLRKMWWDTDPSQAPSGQQHIKQHKHQHCDSLQHMPRIASCKPKMERSHEGQELPVLREDVYLYPGTGENVQQGMREQTSVDEAPYAPRIANGVTARVDRLKAIGNGQVPLCAATAWRLLNER